MTTRVKKQLGLAHHMANAMLVDPALLRLSPQQLRKDAQRRFHTSSIVAREAVMQAMRRNRTGEAR